MSVTKYPYPVTLAYETFTPSSEVVRALGELFEEGARPQNPELLTTSRRILDQQAFRAGQYDVQLGEAARRLDSEFGRKALAFSGRTAEKELSNGDARIFFEMTPQVELDRAVHAMIPLGGLKERMFDGNGALYLDIARDSLVQSVARRRNALMEFGVRARHITTKERMTVANPRIVTRNIDAYPLVKPPEAPRVPVTYDD